MGATMLEELLPRRSAWITGNHWLASFFNVWRHLLGLGCSLRAVVTLLAVLLRALVVASLVASASPLGRALDIVLFIGTIPARFGSYEGDELVYLCRMKSGLGLTQTSSSYVPPTCRSGILFRTSPPIKMALPRSLFEKSTSWPCSQTRCTDINALLTSTTWKCISQVTRYPNIS